jgi:tetratricopeptide (TPR) repeat protein
MFTQETADFVRTRMEMWERLALEEMEAYRELAENGDWKGALAEAAKAAEQKGVLLFSLLLLMEEEDSEQAREATRFSESLLPPETDLVWQAYRGRIPTDTRIEEICERMFPAVLRFAGRTGVKRLEKLFSGFSAEGRIAAARVLAEAEVWDSVLRLLSDLQETDNEETFRLLGVASYRLGDRAAAQRYFLRAREITPSAETDSYLQWLGEAAADA